MALSSILLALFCMTSTLFCRWICFNRKSTVLSKLHEDYQTFFSRKLPVKGHSQTTLIRFTLLLTTYHPLSWHFLWYKRWKNGNFWTTHLSHLVNIFCECPLRHVCTLYTCGLTLRRVQLRTFSPTSRRHQPFK